MPEDLQSGNEPTSEATIPFESLKYIYSNDDGTFWIDGRNGLAAFKGPDGRQYEAPLIFRRYSTLKGVGDEGYIYEIEICKSYIFFSVIALLDLSDGSQGSRSYSIYHSRDGRMFREWLAPGRARRTTLTRDRT